MVACPNEVRPPFAVVTCKPSRRLPIVACHDELSVKAQYSHEPTDRIKMNATPVNTFESHGLMPKSRPNRRRPTSRTKVSSSAPAASMAISIEPAHTRRQKPAYTTGPVAPVGPFAGDRSALAEDRGPVSKSPQKRQNSPSAKRLLPQFAHTSSTAISIGWEYYARRC